MALNIDFLVQYHVLQPDLSKLVVITSCKDWVTVCPEMLMDRSGAPPRAVSPDLLFRLMQGLLYELLEHALQADNTPTDGTDGEALQVVRNVQSP